MRRRLSRVVFAASLVVGLVIAALWTWGRLRTEYVTLVGPSGRLNRQPEFDRQRWPCRSYQVALRRGGVEFLIVTQLGRMRGWELRHERDDRAHDLAPDSRKWMHRAGFSLDHRLHRNGELSITRFTVPFWPIALAAGVAPGIAVARLLRRRVRRRRERMGLCARCGYDLRSSSDKCPECGTPVPSPHPAATPGEVA